MPKLPLKRYIVRKYIMAMSAQDAMKKDKKAPIEDCWIDDKWIDENKGFQGFTGK